MGMREAPAIRWSFSVAGRSDWNLSQLLQTWIVEAESRMKPSCRTYTPSCLGMVVKVDMAKVPSSIESSSSVDGVEASLFVSACSFFAWTRERSTAALMRGF